MLNIAIKKDIPTYYYEGLLGTFICVVSLIFYATTPDNLIIVPAFFMGFSVVVLVVARIYAHSRTG